MAEKIVGNFELTIGRSGTPGAPIFSFPGKASEDGSIGPGQGKITQALPPPNGNITVNIKSGNIRQMGITPNNDIVVSLEGSYNPNPDAPAELRFEAMATFPSGGSGGEMTGTGGFSHQPKAIEGVPATLKAG